MAQKIKNIKKKKTSIRRKMVFYFLMMAIANVFVALEFLWEIKSEKYRKEIRKEVIEIQEGREPVEHIYISFDKLAIKFMIMAAILILVSAVILFQFVTQVASPIQYMIDRARKIAEGDLSLTIEIKTSDELSSLGNLINDLTANLQEIIAQLEQVFISLDQALTQIDKKMNLIPEFREHFATELQELKEALSQLTMLKESFTLFQIQHVEALETGEKSIGELLVDDKIITQEELEKALDIQLEKGGFLGAILVTQGYIDPKTLASYIKKQEEKLV
ncbi:MAG: HAMP domain-containing protein [Spirochaetia bacterium]|nr:HAMP domain-containing protein [Spirochaetia bacterium]